MSQPTGVKGFVSLSKRKVAERSFVWLGSSCRLSKGYERCPDSSENWIRINGIHGMLNRLTDHRPYLKFNYQIVA